MINLDTQNQDISVTNRIISPIRISPFIFVNKLYRDDEGKDTVQTVMVNTAHIMAVYQTIPDCEIFDSQGCIIQLADNTRLIVQELVSCIESKIFSTYD